MAQKNTKKRYSPRTHSQNRKMGDSKDKEFKSEDKGSKYNDPKWYIRNGQLASDVASLSFNTALGAQVSLDVDNTGDWNAASQPLGVPGVLTLNWVPSVGASTGGYSPINIAAKNIYSNIRSRNSGGKNYDSPDLMMYLIAMDSVYSAIQHLQRAYGTAHIFSQLNRYVGDAYLTAMGFAPESVRANLAQFRAAINMLIVKASAYAVPRAMPLYERHAWMSRCAFMDAPLEKAQMYIYRPLGFYKYIEATSISPAGSCMIMPCAVENVRETSSGHQRVSVKTWTVPEWINYVEDLLAALVYSEDIAIMSGDIIKAYGDELFRLVAIPDDYSLEIGYSDEVLDQIHNTIFSGAYPRTILNNSTEAEVKNVNWASFDIAQNTSIGDGAILTRPQFARCKQLGIKHIVDMADKQPTPERVLVATRNMIAGDVYVSADGSNTPYANLTTCGSDICMFANMYDFYKDEHGFWILRNRNVYHFDAGLDAEVNDPGDLSAFTKFPIGYIFAGPAATDGFINLFGQIDNFTVVDRSVLSKLHESAMLSLFGVPV